MPHTVPRRRLTKAKWARLRRAFVFGHSLGAISQATGVSRGTLSASAARHDCSQDRVAGTEILRKQNERWNTTQNGRWFHRERFCQRRSKKARRMLKASISLVQQRWGKLDRRKHLTRSIHIYEIRPRADKHGFDLSSDAIPYSPLWYRGSNVRRCSGLCKVLQSATSRRDSRLRCYSQRDRDARIQARSQTSRKRAKQKAAMQWSVTAHCEMPLLCWGRRGSRDYRCLKVLACKVSLKGRARMCL